MEHSGPIGEARAQAARIFGADRTLFVTNGTSTANKIVFHACVRHGDVVLVDRNCHKSIMHAIMMTGAIPVYLHPAATPTGSSDRSRRPSGGRRIVARCCAPTRW